MPSSVQIQAEGFGDAAMAEINITPFTDVLLVLLIIFMLLAATAAPPGFQKSFMKSARGGPGPELAPIIVAISASSRVTIDGAYVPAAVLYAAMAHAVSSHGADPKHDSKHIEVIGSAAAPYDSILRVMDAGRQAGDDDVGLVIR
jgi:biopolymer transport protein ExbD